MNKEDLDKANEAFEIALRPVIQQPFISQIKLSPKGESLVTAGVAISGCKEVYIQTSNDKTWQGVVALLQELKNELRAAGYNVDPEPEVQPVPEVKAVPTPIIKKAPESAPDTVSGDDAPKQSKKKKKSTSKSKED